MGYELSLTALADPLLRVMPRSDDEHAALWRSMLELLEDVTFRLGRDGRLLDADAIPPVVLTNRGSLQIEDIGGGSVLETEDIGASAGARISIRSHQVAAGSDRSGAPILRTYNAGTIGPLEYAVQYYVYAIDRPPRGGSVAYIAARDARDAVQDRDSYYLGQIETATDGQVGSTPGGYGAGAGNGGSPWP